MTIKLEVLMYAVVGSSLYVSEISLADGCS